MRRDERLEALKPDVRKRILDLAHQKGLLPEERLSGPGNETETVLESLIQQGALTPEMIDELRTEVEEDTRDREQDNSGEPLAALGTFGRFEELQFIGRGGVAKVFKAYDPTLHRNVALKLLSTHDPEVKARFFREARAQARVEHKHVCKVYEVGEIDDRPYIAMQFIDGPTLKAIMHDMNLEEKVRLMHQVAEAVHEAHRVGLIHRDLKPGNIMVEVDEDGQRIPFVMDFGLAREIRTSGLTETGVVMGTLWYMSPEQARGKVHELDRRSDIYSLGVTLYELLSGKLPYENDSTVHFLVDLTNEDPLTIKRGHLPGDLEAIVLKCLEKEVDRRYDSARALADDLQRYLDGEPTLARPPSRVYRWRKKLRKNRFAAVLIALATLLSLILAGLWFQERKAAQERAAIAQQLGQEVERIEANLRHVYLLPLHDVRPERQKMMLRMRSIENKVTEIGKLAKLPGSYALGRGYVALQEFEKARMHLQDAWDNGFQTPEVAYDLGRVMAELYQKEVKNARGVEESRRKQIEKQYGAPALSYLKRAQSLERETRDYLEALIAYLDKNYDSALQKAKSASRVSPWLYEADRLSGNILQAMANERRRQGDNPGTKALYREAEAAFREAVRKGQSDPTGYEGLCNLECERMELYLYQTGESPQNVFENALKYCDQALIANPESTDAISLKAHAYWRWAEYQDGHAQDPEAALLKSIDTAKQALDLDPQHTSALNSMALANNMYGFYLFQSGKDPLPYYETGIENLEKAIRITPSSSYYNNLAIVYSNKGDYEFSTGKGAMESYELAIGYYRKAVETEPEDYVSKSNVGSAHTALANYLATTGKDPQPHFEKALECFEIARQQNPSDIYLYANLGYTYYAMGDYRLLHNLSPQKELTQSRESILRAAAMDPQDAYYKEMLAEIDITEAEWRVSLGESPEELLSTAIGSIRTAREMDPDSYSGLWLEGEWNRWQAEWKLMQKQSPSAEIRHGLEAFQKAIEMNPREAGLHADLGVLYLVKARAASSTQEARASLTEARRQLESALQMNQHLKPEYQKYLDTVLRMLAEEA